MSKSSTQARNRQMVVVLIILAIALVAMTTLYVQTLNDLQNLQNTQSSVIKAPTMKAPSVMGTGY